MNLTGVNLTGVNLISHLVQRQLGPDPPLTRDLVVEQNLPVPMPDGTVLLATGGRREPAATSFRSRSCAAPTAGARCSARAWSGRWPSAASR